MKFERKNLSRDPSAEFGGSLLTGKRRALRPLNPERPIHLVLKARNQWLLLRHRRIVEQVFAKFSRKFAVQLFGLGVHSDHVHASVQTPDRRRYNAFIRAVSAELVRLIPGLRWALRPYTRIGEWGRDFRNVIRYIKRNILEAELLLEGDLAVQMCRQRCLAILFGY